MSFRIGSSLHEKLLGSSTANERSLSEEIERRLENSFEADDLAPRLQQSVLASVFGSPEAAYLVQPLSAAMTLAQIQSGKPPNDFETRAITLRSIAEAAEAHLGSIYSAKHVEGDKDFEKRVNGAAEGIIEFVAKLMLRDNPEIVAHVVRDAVAKAKATKDQM